MIRLSRRKAKIRWIKGKPFVRVVAHHGREETIDLYSSAALQGLVDYMERLEVEKLLNWKRKHND